MSQEQLSHLSIGDHIPERRLGAKSYTGTVQLEGKPVHIEVSPSAVKAIMQREQALLVELELYFSCLVRKQLRFRPLQADEAAQDRPVQVLPGLYMRFRAVTTRHCAVVDVGGKPPVDTMPIRHPERFVPDWIKIDFRARQWLGEYGFAGNTA